MNKRKALELLVDYLNEYSTSMGFYFHNKFCEELRTVISKNAVGCEKEVFSIMVKQFGFIKTMGYRVNEADSNEILKGIGQEQDYYSLHIQNRTVNIRMLLTFMDDCTPVFLAAFFEKEGKKVSDYSQWKPIIKNRYKQITGE